MIGAFYNVRKDTCKLYSSALAIICLFLFVGLLLPVHAETASGLDEPGNVTLHYFSSRYCPHCLEAKSFVDKLPEIHPWLTLHSYELFDNRDNQVRYASMTEKLKLSSNQVPAFIFCSQMMVGYDHAETTGRQLEEKLLACHHQKNPQQHQIQEDFVIPWLGNVHYKDFSLPIFTLVVAALDAFNPCAFFVLLFLLSIMAHTRSQTRMLVIGSIFVLCSGVMYFLFMSAWLNIFVITGPLPLITAVAGAIAISFGLINIKDYFFFKKSFSLSLSNSARSRLITRMRTLTQTGSWATMLGATIILAITANSYELLCTAGLPMIYTRILTLNELASTQYYLYLGLYNVIYVIPLLLIVLMFTRTLGSRKLSELEGRLLKLLSGSMMMGLGTMLLLKPEWLGNMLASVGVILMAFLLTAAVALMQKITR
ncbi:MAG: hypothetical protein DRR06_15135 [Gammaproteobacteria bacterium]|nr:MAG: hypothetical protein DRR06_15135 [Gammaproteobacteria bacterium]